MCRGDYTRGYKTDIQGETAQTVVGNVAATFRACGRDNPTRDSRGKICFYIDRKSSRYRKEGSPQKHEQALPVSVANTIDQEEQMIGGPSLSD
eukprot:11303677-Ditylum_brightwellii.AAC.1